MNKVVASISVASALLGVTSVSAQAQPAVPTPPPQSPAAGQTAQAPYTSTNPDQSAAESRPLFYIGKMPVAVWAPVEPPYSSKANGTVAANWPWALDAH
jgi:hypothetical protein